MITQINAKRKWAFAPTDWFFGHVFCWNRSKYSSWLI